MNLLRTRGPKAADAPTPAAGAAPSPARSPGKARRLTDVTDRVRTLVAGRIPEPIVVAALLAPVLAAIGVRFVGSGPAVANAAEIGPAPIIPDVTRADAPAPAVRAAMERAEALVGRPIAPSLLRVEITPERDVQSAPVASQTMTPEAKPEPILPPGVKLSAVARGRTGPVALIDERPRMVGDEVAPGWVIAAIDLRSRRVLLIGPKGTRHTLRLGVAGAD